MDTDIDMDNNVTTIAWALLKVNHSPKKTTHKIIAECYDPQANKISWRLSSDILNVKQDNTTFVVMTKMGCNYLCKKESEDTTKIIEDSLESLKESFDIEIVKMDDWLKDKKN